MMIGTDLIRELLRSDKTFLEQAAEVLEQFADL